ncbi:MAG: glycerophosphodiester phosphodiesterase family protein [Myxococcota bacterium]
MRSAGKWLLFAAVCAGLAMPAGAEDATLRERLTGLRAVAHRGGFDFPNSNTIERFEIAMREGADVVETDLQVSSDGVPFLFHDATLERVTNCKGMFWTLPASAIERCRLNGLNHGPERFETALQWSRGRVVIDAEFKTAAVIRPAIALVQQYGAYEWVYFQVRNGLSLYREARAFDSYVALEAAPVGDNAESELAELLALDDPRLLIIQLHENLLTDHSLRAIRDSGKLTSIDAWRIGSERLWSFWPFQRTAACDLVFRDGIDIAISNTPSACARQRDAARLLEIKARAAMAQ